MGIGCYYPKAQWPPRSRGLSIARKNGAASAGNTESPWSTPPPAEGVSSRVLFELEESGQFPGEAAFSALLSLSCALTGVNSVGRPYFRSWQQGSATGCILVNTPHSPFPSSQGDASLGVVPRGL